MEKEPQPLADAGELSVHHFQTPIVTPILKLLKIEQPDEFYSPIKKEP